MTCGCGTWCRTHMSADAVARLRQQVILDWCVVEREGARRGWWACWMWGEGEWDGTGLEG